MAVLWSQATALVSDLVVSERALRDRVAELVAERDAAQAQAEAACQDVARMRPVVAAACRWVTEVYTDLDNRQDLRDAVRVYLTLPAEKEKKEGYP